jgi:hypothetical protein
LIRIAIAVPANANYQVVSVNNPYGCNESDVISMYRRPLPTTNLRFLSAVMFDGRESTSATGTTKIVYNNYPSSLLNDLAHQSVDATVNHAQGDGTRPTPTEQQQIVDFEMALTTAQAFGSRTGLLHEHGGNGGPVPLSTQPFFISVNSSVHFLLPQFEQPGGLMAEGDGQFTPAIFNPFDAWTGLPHAEPRAAVARGQAIFNSRPINITGVAGINDDVSAGGLAAGGIPSLTGTCGTCHDTPNVGNHSFPTPLNIGTGDPDVANAAVNLGGLDINYLPSITVCKLDSTGGPTNNCKTTTDLGQGLIDGNFDHVGKIKGADTARAFRAGSVFPQRVSPHPARRCAFLRNAIRTVLKLSRRIGLGGILKFSVNGRAFPPHVVSRLTALGQLIRHKTDDSHKLIQRGRSAGNGRLQTHVGQVAPIKFVQLLSHALERRHLSIFQLSLKQRGECVRGSGGNGMPLLDPALNGTDVK